MNVQPVRIQRSRRAGSRLTSPNDLPIVCVSRPGVFGNPFPWRQAREAGYRGTDAELKEFAVGIFREWLTDNARYGHGFEDERQRLLARLPELRGKNLACWCGPDDCCHADVLLELVNRTPSPLPL